MNKSKFKFLKKMLNVSWLTEPKEGETSHRRTAMHWLLFILLVLVTTALVSYRGGRIPEEFKEGIIAPYDIKADRDYEIVDEEATAKFKTESMKKLKQVYTFDPYLGAGIAERVKAAFEEMKRLSGSFELPNRYVKRGRKIIEKKLTSVLSGEQSKELKAVWQDMVGVNLSAKEWTSLVDSEFEDETLAKLSETIKTVMSYPIISDPETLAADKEKGIVVRILPAADKSDNVIEEDWNAEDIDKTLTAAKMKKEVIKGKYLPENLRIDSYGDRMVIAVASELIQPNMVFDAQQTEVRKQNTLKNIKKVVITIQTGESIVRGGARYETWHIKVLNGIKLEKSVRSLPMEMLGSFLMIFTIYLVVFFFGSKHVRRFATRETDIIFLGIMMIVMLLFFRIALVFTSAIYGMAMSDIPRMALSYAIPLAAGVMLVRFVLNCETAALFAIVLSSFAGIVLSGNLYYTSYALITGLVAAFAISNADKRSSILQAGIVTGVVSAIIVLSIHLINAASVVEPLSLNNIVWYELAAFINGVGCAVFVLVMTPLVESMFGYTTDIKLLELANLNHPLLRELIIRAPGTYHHSHLVGILAESGAEAVGANPLLARVGAYYHDIGKMKKPQYFTENMPEDVSIHDNLSPHMSALIIGSHVKEGIELAKMYKLPKVIMDMIPQHHGSKKIGFFYQKAKEQVDPSMQKIEEKDFKYPGPKPQTREAAILMLADGAEAAVRSVKEKNPQRIQQMVESIIDKSFTENQLNECELTLKDLNEIAKAFTRILSSIYHQRVQYPKESLAKKDADEVSVFEEREEDESGSDKSSQKEKGSS